MWCLWLTGSTGLYVFRLVLNGIERLNNNDKKAIFLDHTAYTASINITPTSTVWDQRTGIII